MQTRLSQMDQQEIEAALLCAPPRTVYFRDKAHRAVDLRVGIRNFVLFLSPAYVAGLFFLLCAIRITVPLVYGLPITGVIIPSESRMSLDLDPAHVTYTYYWKGKPHVATAGADRDSLNSRSFGKTVALRFLPQRPDWPAALAGTGSNALWRMWLFPILWNGLFLSLPLLAIRQALSLSRFISHGIPTTATVIDKTLETSKGATTFRITYQYVPSKSVAHSGEPVIKTESVLEVEWDSVLVDDKMTVLYLPEDGAKSILYRFYHYRAAPLRNT